MVSYKMLEWAKQLDTSLFFFLNKDIQNGFFDVIMPFISGRSYFIVMPFFILLFIREPRKMSAILAVSFLSLLLADGTGNVFKHIIGRVRPCNAFENVHLLVGCGKAFSMPSNHAANASAFASPFFFMTRNPLRYAFVSTAVLVGFSRVYMGAHYPLDVIAGSILGVILAAALTYLYLKTSERFTRKKLGPSE